MIWKTLCHQKHRVPHHAIIESKVSCVFHVKLTLLNTREKNMFVEPFHIGQLLLKITGELLLATILKGLVIIYPPVGGRGRVQGWRILLIEDLAGVTITRYPSMKFCTFLWSSPFRSHFRFTDSQFSIVFCCHALSGKTDSPLSPAEKPFDPPKFCLPGYK